MPSIAHLPDHGLAESCRRYDERGVHCLGRCPLVEVCQCLRGSLEGAELSDCHRHGNQDHEKHTYIHMHAMANAHAIGSPTLRCQPELRQSVVLCVQLIPGASSVWQHRGIHTASDLGSSMVLKHGLCDNLVVFTNHFLASPRSRASHSGAQPTCTCISCSRRHAMSLVLPLLNVARSSETYRASGERQAGRRTCRSPEKSNRDQHRYW